MSESEKEDKKQYNRLRSEFDDLQLEEKAVFLIESGLSLLIHGLDSIFTFIRDEINKVSDSGVEEAEGQEDPEKQNSEEDVDGEIELTVNESNAEDTDAPGSEKENGKENPKK